MKQYLYVLLGLAILASTLPADSAARTWYVKQNGTGDVPTIQAGIDSAGVGDTVLVAPGNYTWSNQGTGTDYGMIPYYRDVSGFELRSEAGPEFTVLDAEGRGRVILIVAPSWKIRLPLARYTPLLGISSDRQKDHHRPQPAPSKTTRPASRSTIPADSTAGSSAHTPPPAVTSHTSWGTIKKKLLP